MDSCDNDLFMKGFEIVARERRSATYVVELPSSNGNYEKFFRHVSWEQLQKMLITNPQTRYWRKQ
jgi:hypothetical protein